MNTSIREQVLARSLVLLSSGIDGVNLVERSPVNINRDVSPAIAIRPDSEEDDLISGGHIDRHDFFFEIEVFVRGNPWDSQADPIATKAHKLILNDLDLQTLVTRIRKVASRWEAEDADKTAGLLTMRYRVQYETKASDIADANFF